MRAGYLSCMHQIDSTCAALVMLVGHCHLRYYLACRAPFLKRKELWAEDIPETYHHTSWSCSGSMSALAVTVHSYCHLAPFSSGQSHLLSDAVLHLSQASLTPNWLKQSELMQESMVWLQGSRRPCTGFWSVGTCKLCVTFTDSVPPSSPCGLAACGP